MSLQLIKDDVVKEHIVKIVNKKMSKSTWTGEELLGAIGGRGSKLPPLLAINMYVSALFVIIDLLRYIEDKE